MAILHVGRGSDLQTDHFPFPLPMHTISTDSYTELGVFLWVSPSQGYLVTCWWSRFPKHVFLVLSSRTTAVLSIGNLANHVLKQSCGHFLEGWTPFRILPVFFYSVIKASGSFIIYFVHILYLFFLLYQRISNVRSIHNHFSNTVKV